MFKRFVFEKQRMMISRVRWGSSRLWGRSHILDTTVKKYTTNGSTRKVLPDKETTLQKFVFPAATSNIKLISKDLHQYLNTKVCLYGWINNKPRKLSKTLVFSELRDINGDVTQVLVNCKDESSAALKALRDASLEDAICVTGTIARRRAPKETSNKKIESEHQPLQEDKWDLIVEDYLVLNKSNDLPSQIQELSSETKNSEDYPAKYRYLQLRQKFFQTSLKTRAKAASTVRKSLDSLGFTEIETPLLFKSTPEGAREFLVPTRRPGQFYALPQSPQQYKQLLMASGVNRYYQIAKCFRDEDLRKDRQPEFTQVDLELAFSKPEDVQVAVTKTVKRVWEDVRGLAMFTLKGDDLVQVGKDDTFAQLSYNDALTNYGIDKPDLRSSLKIHNLTTSKEYGIQVIGDRSEEFSIFEVCILRGAFDTEAPKKRQIPSAIFSGQDYSNRKPVIVPIKAEEDKEKYLEKFLGMIDFESEESKMKLIRDLDLKQGDIIAGSTRAELSYENPTPIGRFRQLAIDSFPGKWRRKLLDCKGEELQSKMNVEDVFVATWVVDFPLFSPQEDANSGNDYPIYDYTRFASTHHPFTMCKPEDYEFLETEPLKVHGEHYDLVINGVELGGGSRRIHDTALQRYIFAEILKIEDPDRLFGHLLAAFEVGCPPHSGLAIGFDRMCAMLINSSSIRDVVAFPKTKTGSDAVVSSPSDVADKVLQQYYIKKS